MSLDAELHRDMTDGGDTNGTKHGILVPFALVHFVSTSPIKSHWMVTEVTQEIDESTSVCRRQLNPARS